jgi:subtilase family serine protease
MPLPWPPPRRRGIDIPSIPHCPAEQTGGYGLPEGKHARAFRCRAEQQLPPKSIRRRAFPTPNCGYSPKQLRTAYGVQAAAKLGNNGHGVTVAIIDAYDSPTILADANAYAALQSEPAFGAGQFIDDSVNPSTFNDQAECGGEAGWNTEQTLDVEAVHGLAPGATVAYVGAQNCDTASTPR